MRVFSNSFSRGCTLGRSWAVEEAQEQVDRDTPVSRTLTEPILETQFYSTIASGATPIRSAERAPDNVYQRALEHGKRTNMR
jgi:hypothetical protein